MAFKEKEDKGDREKMETYKKKEAKERSRENKSERDYDPDKKGGRVRNKSRLITKAAAKSYLVIFCVKTLPVTSVANP
jgi:hypothetical protein